MVFKLAIGSEEVLVVIVFEPTALSRKSHVSAHKRAKVAGDGPAERGAASSSGDGECPQHLEALIGSAQVPAMFIDEHLSTWDVRC